MNHKQEKYCKTKCGLFSLAKKKAENAAIADLADKLASEFNKSVIDCKLVLINSLQGDYTDIVQLFGSLIKKVNSKDENNEQ